MQHQSAPSKCDDADLIAGKKYVAKIGSNSVEKGK
jgi:hypothetical protein